MRMFGLKSLIAAAGLALASAGAIAAPAPPPSQGAAPATAAAPATEAPASPLLAQDGAPAIAIDSSVGQPHDGVVTLQQQVTPNGQRAHWMHDVVLFPIITIISLFVLGLLLWVMIRYRASRNPNPSKTSHNTLLEVIWTGLPVLILLAVAVPSLRLLAAQFKPAPKGAITLKATGNQWFWTYEYPDHGGIQITSNLLKEQNEVAAGQRARTDADGPRLLAVDNRVVLPVGVPIRLVTTAADVIHSWAVPAFWIKLDAVPGRINETSFTINKPGLYFGQCSELCGARHAYMPIAVQAVSQAQFAAWVAAKGGKMPSGTGAGPTTGNLPATSPAADAAQNASAPADLPANQADAGNTALVANGN